jgi:hypothetical protein
MLERLQVNHDDIADVYFTGGLTSPAQTDLHFQYKATDGRYHNYFPDFVIVKTDGSFVIVEVKADGKQHDPDVLAKEKEVRRVASLPENKFAYHILYTNTPIPARSIRSVMEMLQ